VPALFSEWIWISEASMPNVTMPVPDVAAIRRHARARVAAACVVRSASTLGVIARDERCSADDELPPLDLVVEGKTITARIGQGLSASQPYRVHVTVSGTAPFDALLDATPSVEDYGCDGSNLTIRLRYDERSRILRPV